MFFTLLLYNQPSAKAQKRWDDIRIKLKAKQIVLVLVNQLKTMKTMIQERPKKAERRSSPAVYVMGMLALVQMSVESARSGHIFHATYTIRERIGEGIIDARDVYIN